MRAASLACAALACLVPVAAHAQASVAAPSPASAAASEPGALTYAARVTLAIRQNLEFETPLAGNPVAEVVIFVAPDGRIISRKLTKASATAAWDAAVLKAIDRTVRLPLDADGHIPPQIVIRYALH